MSRIKLYALSVRNTIGRTFGAANAYTPAQRANALAMWRVFRTRYDATTSAALLGCADGECSFLLAARGDKNEAGGAYQWHADRRNMIMHYEGIDVWDATAAQNATAVMAEMSESWSWYKRVERALLGVPTLEEKMRVLVSKLEQSGMQDRDVARRTPLAQYWLSQDLDHAGDAVS